MQAALRSVRFFALTLWAVGVQAHEALGTVGLALLAVSSIPELKRVALREWWPVLAFIGWALLAPTIGGNPPDGTGVARVFDWLAVPFAALAFSELDEVRRRRFVWAVAGTFALSCVLAGLQYFGAWPKEEAFAGLAFLHVPFHRVYEPVAEGATRYMGGGLLFHRLKFAHVSGLVLVGLTALGARDRKVLALVLAGLGAVWLFPYARMGAVAAGVGVAVTGWLSSQNPRRAGMVIAGLGLVGVLAVLAVEPLRARFIAGLTDQGSGQRTQHLSAGLEAIRQHPFVGVGPGQFRPSRFGGPDMAEHVRDNPGKAHNQFVSMAAETGLIGGLGFVALLGWLAWRARKAPWGAVTLGALAQFGVLSLVHDPLFQAPYSMGLVLILGLGLAVERPLAEPR